MTEKPHPKDTCDCGDWRKDHKDGVGVCIFTESGIGTDGHGGAGKCNEFKLAWTYKQELKNASKRAEVGIRNTFRKQT